ncbi:MalY/PatB family protein [Micromonospora globbae]|uniref:cysteine-S-conjugate beta-lyase n=1 Tax=Micromonospora globbae TaxID=1894969 RepID=A0A420ESR0_9ACTN|nr:aminotransferase class I/II-fold pyridoxal phosphate-dependent enzyme [Micromonospora globbae]RKF23715.1 aminotransferase class I/II-fold pyridoxal phosphate-dependent enzyme [Micromonospora globbae]
MGNLLETLSLTDLRRRTSEKWRRYPEDVLPLWVAEMDVPLAEPVTRALAEAINLGDTGYAHGPAYAEALAGFAAERWGWTVDVARTRAVPDVMMGVVEVLDLVTGHGDAVVVNPPVYPPYYQFLRSAGRRIVEAPLEGRHRLDPDALDRAFAEAVAGGRRAAYLLCSPHNPTGTLHTRAELSTVAELAARHGVRVVVDEIHAPLVYPGATFVPYLSLPGTERDFALLSASKAWNLAGVKAAVAVAGADAAADLARMPAEVNDGVSHLAVIAHTAALRHGGPWLDDLLSGLDANRHLLADLLAERLPGVRYQPPDATYLAWLDCRALELPGGPDADPATVFLERGRVAFVPGPDFGTGGAGHLRLNFATSPDVLTEAVRRMVVSLG